jgi:hypothetical protein
MTIKAINNPASLPKNRNISMNSIILLQFALPVLDAIFIFRNWTANAIIEAIIMLLDDLPAFPAFYPSAAKS